MPDKITCPVCHETAEPIVKVRGLAICGVCGASIRMTDEGISRATHADTVPLTDDEIGQLRRARASIVRPTRPQTGAKQHR